MKVKCNGEILKIAIEKGHTIQNEKIRKLFDIWMDIGFGEDVIKRRLCTVNDHIENLFNEMISEAEIERAEIADEVNVLLTKICSLRKRLRISGPMIGYENMPFIEVIPQLKSKIKEYEEEIENYLTNLKRLMCEEQHLCANLGRKTKEICLNPLPLQTEINDFENYVEGLKQLQFEREEEFVKLKMDIIQCLKDLDEKPTLEFHRDIVADVGGEENKSFRVTDENMQRLKEWHASLQKQVEEKKLVAVELRDKITFLWELLEESMEYRTNFTSQNSGFSDRTINKLNEEIKRCEEKKKANIKMFVDKLREEIVEWWDKCSFGKKQREEFALFNSDCYNEDLLTLHELQLDKLKKHYENATNIYSLLHRRNELWKKCIYLAEKANCPSRFKNRGGELLKEERERKEVGQRLPEIEKQLLDEVRNYEQQSRKPFLINDMTVEDLILQDRNRFKEGQYAKLSAKKKARDNTVTSVTPSKIVKCLRRPATPTASLNNTATKRIRLLSTPQSVSSKRNNKLSPVKLPKTVPKIKINKRLSVKLATCRRKLNAKRRSKDGISPSIRRNMQTPIQTKEYQVFKEGVLARSSVFVHTEQKENRQKMPEKSLIITNKSPKTPKDATKLRPVSPGQLPFIF